MKNLRNKHLDRIKTILHSEIMEGLKDIRKQHKTSKRLKVNQNMKDIFQQYNLI